MGHASLFKGDNGAPARPVIGDLDARAPGGGLGPRRALGGRTTRLDRRARHKPESAQGHEPDRKGVDDAHGDALNERHDGPRGGPRPRVLIFESRHRKSPASGLTMLMVLPEPQ